VAVGKQRGAVAGAMGDDDGGEVLEFFLGDAFPQFTGEGEVTDVDVDARLVEHTHDKILVHGDTAAVGVKVASGEFDGLAKHDAKGDVGYIQFIGDGQGLTDIVAVFHKSLLRQVGVKRFYKALTLAAAVDDHAVAARCLGHLHALADARHKRLLAERLDDARNADDADAALNAQSRVESAARDFGPLRHADGNADVFLDVVAHHPAWSLVDGGFSWREVKARHGESANTLAAEYLKMVAGLNACPDLDAVGHIRVVARLLEHGSIAVTISDIDLDCLAIGKGHRNGSGLFTCQ